MKKKIKNNGLSISAFLFFAITLIGQAITGFKQYNLDMQEQGGKTISSFKQYFITGHFIEATFENWESEFLQMGMFVVLTAFLYQKGSSESKDPEAANEKVDKTPSPDKKDAPWPVKRGGLVLKLYEYSLSLALFLIFIISFILHWYGSLKVYNQQLLLKGKPLTRAFSYLSNSKLWFESFQNWQSEFLSVFAMVVLSIFLRHKGSSQSKPVDAPDSLTTD